MNILTQEKLKEQVTYDPTTGVFVRLVRAGRIPANSVFGNLDGKGYLRGHILGRNYSLHRLAWFYIYGEWPKGCVDHLDRNPTNNRLTNLRSCTLAENQWNREKGVSKKTGLPTGVSLEKRTGKFYARIGRDWGKKHLGTFDTVDDAAEAWLAADKLRKVNRGD